VKSSGSDVDVSQRNASIRNLFAPSPGQLAKKKEARQRSQSSFSLQRVGATQNAGGQMEDKAEAEAEQHQMRLSTGKLAGWENGNGNGNGYGNGFDDYRPRAALG
ncbi:hypothetical protein KR009_006542, partial [Drosophila setifemur]